jgi:RNA polymerase sigma-70 factor (family 1)
VSLTTLEDDLALLRRIQSGEESAFEGLFQRYYPALVGFARRVLVDLELAEEAVQDVFVVFWEKRQQVNIQQSVKSYLYASVYHKCLRHTRHEKVREKYRQEILKSSDEADAADAIAAIELEERIEKVISRLPDQCRRIFSMSRFDGMKYQEIADALGLSIKTVEIQISKALKILREELKDYLTTFIWWMLLISALFLAWRIGVNDQKGLLTERAANRSNKTSDLPVLLESVKQAPTDQARKN